MVLGIALMLKVLNTATFRLAGLYLFLFTFSVCLVVGLLFFQMRTLIETEAREQIQREIHLLRFEYQEEGLDELLEETEERIEKGRHHNRLMYSIQNPAGRVIFDRIGKVSEPYGWRYLKGDHEGIFYFLKLDNDYVLGVGKDLSANYALERAMGRALIGSLVIVLILGTIGGIVLSRRTLAQLDSINRTAHAIGAGRLGERIPVRHTGDELDDLGKNLNRVFERIEQLVANVRQVSTGIAHDLRTPLARLRNRLEHLRDESEENEQAVQEAIDEVDNILHTFAALLRLAELEAGSLKTGFQRWDLSVLTHSVVEAYSPMAEENGFALKVDIEKDVYIDGDKSLLQQLLVNLIENAFQYAQVPDQVGQVHIALSQNRDCMVLSIADNGPGIPDSEKERILRPFQRMSETKGTGLGLALVVAITELHGAKLTLLDQNPGLCCQIVFPNMTMNRNSH